MGKSNSNQPEDVPQPANAERALQLLRDVHDIRKVEAANIDTQDDRNHVTEISDDEFELANPEADSRKFASIDFPDTLGRFEIERLLGQGGFARVFLARDPVVDRNVALKVPSLPTIATAEFSERFDREARAAGILSHPSIVPVFESGSIGPLSYIAYEFSDGQTLLDWIAPRKKDFPFDQTVAIIEQLADAIEYAHQRGVIHRDLKPANVMIELDSSNGEFSRARITDFGLAKYSTENDQFQTTEGTIVGTPAYMSPEQASGSGQVDHLSDIYSLGVIFFELLSGQLPFQFDHKIKTMQAIAGQDVTSVRQFRHDIPTDLEAICLKCLTRDKTRRYQSAFAIADDLRNWRARRPVSARRPSMLEKSVLWFRRQPVLAATIMVAVLSFVAGLTGTTWQWRTAVANENRAIRSAETAVEAQNFAEQERLKAIAAKKRAEKQKQEADHARENSEAFAEFFVTNVMRSVAAPGIDQGKGKDVTVRELLDSMEGDIDGLKNHPAVEARVRNAFGATWREMGQYSKAAKHFLRAKELSPKTSRSSLQSELELASILFSKGDLKSSRQLLEQNIEDAEVTLGPNDPISLAYRNNLAAVFVRSGNREGAIEQYLRLHDQFTRLHGPAHFATTTIALNLAATYQREGNFSAAIDLLESQAEKLLAEFGEKNFQTVRTQTLLARLLSLSSRVEEAAELFDNVVPVATELLGKENPKTIEVVLFQAYNKQRAGQHQAAIEICKAAHKTCIEKFGGSHPLVDQCNIALAQVYEAAGELAAMEGVLTVAIETNLKLGNEASGLRFADDLAKSVFDQGRFEDCIKLCQKYEPDLDKLLDENDLVVLAVKTWHVRSLRQLNQWTEAADRYRQLLEKYPAESSMYESILTGTWQSHCADCLNELGQAEEAQELARQGHQIMISSATEREILILEAHSILTTAEILNTRETELLAKLDSIHEKIVAINGQRKREQSLRYVRNSLRRLIGVHKSLGNQNKADEYQVKLKAL